MISADNKKYCLMGGCIAAGVPAVLLVLCFIPLINIIVYTAIGFMFIPLFMLIHAAHIYDVLPHFGRIEIVDVLGFIYVSDVLIGIVVYYFLGYWVGWLIWRFRFGKNNH